MVDQALRRKIEDLHRRYIRAIDDDRWEDWPTLFTEPGAYKILTRENFDQGVPLAVMDCRSRGMLQDRVASLRKIKGSAPQRYLHKISGLFIKPPRENVVECWSNYLVVQTGGEGSITTFSSGIYLDKIVLEPGGAKFQERIVVTDSQRSETPLVIPL